MHSKQVQTMCVIQANSYHLLRYSIQFKILLSIIFIAAHFHVIQKMFLITLGNILTSDIMYNTNAKLIIVHALDVTE